MKRIMGLFGLLVLLILVGILSSNYVNAAPPAQATPTAPTSDIGVVGTGSVFTQPDTAIANVGVEFIAPTLADATAEVSKRMTAVLAAVKALGVDAKDITTISYNVYPRTTNPDQNQVPKIIGYQVSNIVRIKIRKLDDTGKILDAAINAGANSLNGVSFTVNDPSAQQDQARTQAVKDAMAKAQTLATAAGVKLGKITSITENVSPTPIPFQRAALALGAGGGGPGPVESGQTEITVNVEMHFQIEQ
jgi:uncharacterized protein YggE